MSDGRDASLTSGDSQSRSAPDLGQSSRPARPIKGAWAAMKPVSSSSTTLEADESDRSQQRDIYSEALSPWLNAIPAFHAADVSIKSKNEEYVKASPALAIASPAGLGRPTDHNGLVSFSVSSELDSTTAIPRDVNESASNVNMKDVTYRAEARPEDGSVMPPALPVSSEMSMLGKVVDTSSDQQQNNDIKETPLLPNAQELFVSSPGDTSDLHREDKSHLQDQHSFPSDTQLPAQDQPGILGRKASLKGQSAAQNHFRMPSIHELRINKAFAKPRPTKGLDLRSSSGASFVMSPDTAAQYYTKSPPPPLTGARIPSAKGPIVYETHEWTIAGFDQQRTPIPSDTHLSPDSWASANMDSADPSKLPHAASLWARLPDMCTFSPPLQPIHIVRGSPPAWANVSPRTTSSTSHTPLLVERHGTETKVDASEKDTAQDAPRHTSTDTKDETSAKSPAAVPLASNESLPLAPVARVPPRSSHLDVSDSNSAEGQEGAQTVAPRVAISKGHVPYSNEVRLSYLPEAPPSVSEAPPSVSVPSAMSVSTPASQSVIMSPTSVRENSDWENDTTLIDLSDQQKVTSLDEILLKQNFSPVSHSGFHSNFQSQPRSRSSSWMYKAVEGHGSALGLHVPPHSPMRTDPDTLANASGFSKGRSFSLSDNARLDNRRSSMPINSPEMSPYPEKPAPVLKQSQSWLHATEPQSHSWTYSQSGVGHRHSSLRRPRQIKAPALQSFALPSTARVADASYAASPRIVSYGAGVVDDSYISPLDPPAALVSSERSIGATHPSQHNVLSGLDKSDTLQAPDMGVVEAPPPTVPMSISSQPLMPALQYTVPFKLSSKRRFKAKSVPASDSSPSVPRNTVSSPVPPTPLPKSPVPRQPKPPKNSTYRKSVPAPTVADENEELDLMAKGSARPTVLASSSSPSFPTRSPVQAAVEAPVHVSARPPAAQSATLVGPSTSSYGRLQPALAPELCGPVQSVEGRNVWLDVSDNDAANTSHLSMLGAVTDRSDLFNFETYFEASLQRIREEMYLPSTSSAQIAIKPPAKTHRNLVARHGDPDLFHNAPPINARTFGSPVTALDEFSYVLDDDGMVMRASQTDSYTTMQPSLSTSKPIPELPPVDPYLPEEHEVMGDSQPISSEARDRRWTYDGTYSPILSDESMPSDVRLPLEFVTKPNSVLSRGRPVKKTQQSIFYSSLPEHRRHRKRRLESDLPPFKMWNFEEADVDSDAFSQSMSQSSPRGTQSKTASPPRPAPPPPPAPKATLLGDYAAVTPKMPTQNLYPSSPNSKYTPHSAYNKLFETPPPDQYAKAHLQRPARPRRHHENHETSYNEQQSRQTEQEPRDQCDAQTQQAQLNTPTSQNFPPQREVEAEAASFDAGPRKKRGKEAAESKFSTWFRRKAPHVSKPSSSAPTQNQVPQVSSPPPSDRPPSPRTSTSTNNTMKYGRRKAPPGFEPSQPGKYHLAGTVSLPTLNVARTPEQRARNETGLPETEPALIQSLLAAPSSSTVRARAGIIKSIPFVEEAAPPTGQVLVAEERKVLVRPVM